MAASSAENVTIHKRRFTKRADERQFLVCEGMAKNRPTGHVRVNKKKQKNTR